MITISQLQFTLYFLSIVVSLTHNLEVPCSSANIGPGFDVIGLALSIWLELRVEVVEGNSQAPLNCVITYEGEGAEEVPLSADSNLITRTALYVLRCHKIRAFPPETRVHIINPIPLGRGLGSSGAASRGWRGAGE